MLYSRRNLVLTFLFALVGVPVWLIWQEVSQEQHNQTLLAAIKKNDAQAVLTLLMEGADPNTLNLSPDTRSFWQRLWQGLQGRRFPSKPAQSALLVAVQGLPGTGIAQEQLPIVKALLDKGANVNARDAQGTTALMSAVNYRHLATVHLLLDKGADVNLKDNDFDVVAYDLGMKGTAHIGGRTALEYADENDDIQTMQLLLKHGANVNDRDYYGETLLIQTAASGNVGKIRFLLANGAAVNAIDKYGRTALMLAANSAYVGIIALLSKQGADVNVRDNEGETALMYSMEGPGDNPQTLQMLLRLGADANIKSRTGKTALGIAQKENYTESIRLLKKAGAKK